MAAASAKFDQVDPDLPTIGRSLVIAHMLCRVGSIAEWAKRGWNYPIGWADRADVVRMAHWNYLAAGSLWAALRIAIADRLFG